MTELIGCEQDSCIHNENSECTHGSILIDSDGVCALYERYNENKSYHQPYYITIEIDETNAKKRGVLVGVYKYLRYGKKLVINGRTYFTQHDDRKDNFGVTDAITGGYLDKANALKSDIEKLAAEHLKRHGFDNVDTLQEVVKIWKDGEYLYVLKEE